MPRHITEYVLYRWRYSIGYVLVGLLVAVLLVAAVLYVPGGLSDAEVTSATNSSRFSFTSFDPMAMIDLPYTILQNISFRLLGVTTLSIKLPSLVLGLFSLFGIILLLRQWFHTNVAVISALIVITTSQFIFSSQDGTPTIMYVLLPTWLLLLALKVSRQTKRRSFWELLLVAALALSLYTPLSIYVILALFSATLLHPHLRYIVSRLSKRKLLAAGVLGLALLSPLIAAITNKPEVGRILLGIPETWPNLSETGLELVRTHLGFLFEDKDGRPQSAYTLPSLLLFLLGVVRLFKTKYTARSYIIVSWMLLLAPIVLINPSKTAITFVPVMLLIAAGIDELLHRWYSMFPRNPYARVAGLLPLTLLVLGMALTGIERYFYVYRYSPPVANTFSNDLSLLYGELNSTNSSTVRTMLVANDEAAFYEAVARRDPRITVVSSPQATKSEGVIIASRAAFYEHAPKKIEVQKIITNAKSANADRLYLYKSQE